MRAAGLACGSSTLTCSLLLRGFPCWAWSPCSAVRFLLPALWPGSSGRAAEDPSSAHAGQGLKGSPRVNAGGHPAE